MINTIIVVNCPFCQKTAELEVSTKGFNAWQSGQYVQDAFPELDADSREQLISGTCPKCWDEIFSVSEEDE